MAIAFVNKGTLTYTTGVAGCTPPLPASIVSGRLLLATVLTQGSGGSHVWPAGWTEIDQQSWLGGTYVGSVAYRIADGADAAPNVTWPSTTFSNSQVFQFSGTTASPISAARSVATGVSDGTHTSAAVTTTANNSLVLCIDLGRGATLLTSPAGWTQDSSEIDSGSLGAVYIGEKLIATSGSSSGAISTAGASNGWVQWQQELLVDADSNGSSTLDLPAIEFANTAVTDTLGTSDQTLAAIIALSEGYSGNSSSVTLDDILALGTADGGNLGSSTQTLASIVASGSAVSAFVHFVEATSTATLTGPVTAAWALFITSTGAFTTTAHAPTIFWEVVTSSTTITGTVADQRVVDATVTGTVTINGVTVGQASYFVSAASVAEIISGIQFVQDFWDGWAYNLNTGAPSTYEDFKFNSFARIGSNYYGCNDTGIHLLSGDSDNGVAIAMVATLGTTDLSVDKIPGDNIKTVPAVYVTAKSAEALELTCRTEGQEYAYLFRTNETSIAPTRVDPGKGLRGTLWQFEIKNKLGSDAEVSVFEATVDNTKRRI